MPRFMPQKTQVLRNLVGQVKNIISPYKAVVNFYLNGKLEKALMKKEKYVFHGELAVNNDYTYHSIIRIGTHVRFVAHNFEPKHSAEFVRDDFKWFVILGWCIEDTKQLMISYIPGIVNAPAKLLKLRKQRQGVLSYDIRHGGSHNILFYGSKVFLYGKRVNSKRPLKGQMYIDDTFCCDAVPCDPNQNDSYCSWFAITVWRGHKPPVKNDPTTAPMTCEALLKSIRSFTSDARTVFIKGRGRVVKVGWEYGIALMSIRQTEWVSVIFHRSSVFLKGTSMAATKLTRLLKKGDFVNLLCVSTHGKQYFRYAAAQVTLDFHPVEEEPDPDSGFNPYYFGR